MHFWKLKSTLFNPLSDTYEAGLVYKKFLFVDWRRKIFPFVVNFVENFEEREKKYICTFLKKTNILSKWLRISKICSKNLGVISSVRKRRLDVTLFVR